MVKDDTTLVRRCLQGDRDAFGLLVKRYEHAAFGLALSYLRDFADAEDVAQEAFVSAYCNLPHLQNPAKFGSWLKTTVVNLCRNTHRSRNAEAASLARMGQERILEGTKAPTPPDQLYELQDLRTRIMKAIGQLSEKNRQAVTMFYIDGLSAEEIGQFLETSTTAINQRLHRARVQLKEEMMDMVEDVLKSSYPKGFPEKVLREIAEQATEAHKQHMHGESVQRYTQALEILDELEETEEQRRWKADMLWERGNATHFLEWKNEEKVIADLEAALALEEGLTNRHKYADHLVQAGVSYSNARKPQKAFDAYQKAASIYESIGNSGGQAQCLYWMATKYIPWFPQERSAVEPDHNQALQHLHRATELFQQAGDAAGEVMSLAASTLLKKIGADPSKEVVESIGTGGGSFVRSAETIHWGTGGGGISRCEGGQDARPVRGIAAYLSCTKRDLI